MTKINVKHHRMIRGGTARSIKVFMFSLETYSQEDMTGNHRNSTTFWGTSTHEHPIELVRILRHNLSGRVPGFQCSLV